MGSVKSDLDETYASLKDFLQGFWIFKRYWHNSPTKGVNEEKNQNNNQILTQIY